MVRDLTDGKKDRTRPVVGAAGWTKLMCRCQDDGGCANMSTPSHPGCNHKELNGRGCPDPRGGMTFKCEACLSNEIGRPQTATARLFAAAKTGAGVGVEWTSRHRDRASATDMILDSLGAHAGITVTP